MREYPQRLGPWEFSAQMLQDFDAQGKRPHDILVGKGVMIVAAHPFGLVVELNMHPVAKLPQLMQVVVNGRAEAIEKLVGLHGLNDVVKPFDLGIADFLQDFRRNVGHAFRGITLCAVDDLIERGFDNRSRLHNHELVERVAFVCRAQTTQRLAVRQNVVANLEVTDKVAPYCFSFCRHRDTFEMEEC